MQIYVHIPFCKKKCRYCDFVSFDNCETATIHNYLDVLHKEIMLAGKKYAHAKVSTIYIGGGTPSMLGVNAIPDIIKTIKTFFSVGENAEITVECNPESISEDKLIAYKNSGVNRLSIGVQSLSDDNLKTVGRIHDSKTAINALSLASKHFENISADLIVGLPYDTEELIMNEVAELTKYAKHISVYTLQLEQGTPLYDDVMNGNVEVKDDDEVEDLFFTAVANLRLSGFERYEVSNFAIKDYESKHNSGYWTGEEYLGFGLNASSYVKTIDGEKPLEKPLRFENAKNIEKYVDGIGKSCDFPVFTENRFELSDFDLAYEKIMLGLRLKSGVDVSAFNPEMLKIVKKYKKFFNNSDGKIALNDNGMNVMNAILVEILDCLSK